MEAEAEAEVKAVEAVCCGGVWCGVTSHRCAEYALHRKGNAEQREASGSLGLGVTAAAKQMALSSNISKRRADTNKKKFARLEEPTQLLSQGQW